MKCFLSVVIPAYNEEENIKQGVLNLVRDYLKKQKYSWEVLVVDDQSTDATLQLSRNYAQKNKGFRVLAEPHRGKGGTVIAGMLAANGQIILFTDMDQATPLAEVAKFIPEFRKSADIVIGSRSGRKGAGTIRKLMAYSFAILRTLILGIAYKDTQCGFKAFTSKSAKQIFKKMKVFTEQAVVKGASVSAGFDLEILYIAKKLNFKVVEVDVVWQHGKTSKVNPIKDSWEGLRDLLKVRLNALLGKY
jgi:dolichyl-phosphate beta-glucosyltransferase